MIYTILGTQQVVYIIFCSIMYYIIQMKYIQFKIFKSFF